MNLIVFKWTLAYYNQKNHFKDPKIKLIKSKIIGLKIWKEMNKLNKQAMIIKLKTKCKSSK
jgi:hypothetical protein